MSEILSKYLAEKVIEDLRAKRYLSNEFFDALFTCDFKDSLRRLVTENDFELLKDLISSDYKNKIVVGHILCRNLLGLDVVRDYLEKLWLSSKNADVKIAIIYDIAEYDLTNKFTKDFFEYLKNEKETYRRHVIDWYGGKDKILDPVLIKLNTPGLEHKKWIYIINLSVSSEIVKATGIIESYITDANILIREIAEYALERIKNS